MPQLLRIYDNLETQYLITPSGFPSVKYLTDFLYEFRD